ncbi:MAG: hypothetical protein IJT65_08490 [Eubacterium sp.]|nr:hypothetical protein [Eubacterium sp.]
MSSICPKCGGKIKATYLKQNCPHCGVNLLYYKLDEQLEKDALQAQKEVDAVNKFVGLIKDSAVKTPLHIIRLILFFTPLASMCLPMYVAGHKKVSLIGFIMSIINHGFDFNALLLDKGYFFAVLSMVCIILLSLAVIISSLFSAGKKGFARNMVFSIINTASLITLGALVFAGGGQLKIGFAVTLIIYAVEILLHYFCDSEKKKSRKVLCLALSIIVVIISASPLIIPVNSAVEPYPIPSSDEIKAVTFNLAGPWGTPFDGTSDKERVVRFKKYMKAVSPDLLGTQELNSFWLDTLKKSMKEYDSYAVKRGGDDSEKTSEMNGVFWKKDKFTLIDKKTFWLSQTPDKESRFKYKDEEGKDAEAGCNRVCTYVILDSAQYGKILFMNTHLDNTSEEACDFGAKLIVDEIAKVKEKYKGINVILTGDFNSTSDSKAYQTITAVLKDTTDSIEERGTYQEWGYKTPDEKPIDFIFTSFSSSEYTVLDYIEEGYISDHYGVGVLVK